MEKNKSGYLMFAILSYIVVLSIFFVSGAQLQGNLRTDVEVETGLSVKSEGNTMVVNKSNGVRSEIKIMPDVAAETAFKRLRLRVCSEENNCTIELKEVGKREQTRVVYEVKVQKDSKILGLFKKKMEVSAQVDAQNGEITKTNKPWWAFLAVEVNGDNE